MKHLGARYTAKAPSFLTAPSSDEILNQKFVLPIRMIKLVKLRVRTSEVDEALAKN